jgi:hypothetical protein
MDTPEKYVVPGEHCLRHDHSPYRFDCGWSLIRREAMSL